MVVTLAETNSVPLAGSGCPGAPTPGITVSNITASSNPDLVGCSQTSVADTFNSKGGAYTMILTPISGSTCKAAGTGGFTLYLVLPMSGVIRHTFRRLALQEGWLPPTEGEERE